jgi:hypothetical protein
VRFTEWRDGSLVSGAGVAIALCRAGGFVAITTPQRPSLGASFSLEIIGLETRSVLVHATVAAYTSEGVEFAIGEASAEFERLVEALVGGPRRTA